MAKTETQIDLKINKGTYAKIQENLSQIGENELIIADDINIPLPDELNEGKGIISHNNKYVFEDVQLKNLITDIETHKTENDSYPSTKAVYDYCQTLGVPIIELSVNSLSSSIQTINLSNEQKQVINDNYKKQTVILLNVGTSPSITQLFYIKTKETTTQLIFNCITLETGIKSFYITYIKNGNSVSAFKGNDLQQKMIATSVQTYSSDNDYYPSTKAVYDFVKGETKYLVVTNLNALEDIPQSQKVVGTIAYVQSISGGDIGDTHYWKYTGNGGRNGFESVSIEQEEPIIKNIGNTFDVNQTYTFSMNVVEIGRLVNSARILLKVNNASLISFLPDIAFTEDGNMQSNLVFLYDNKQYIGTIIIDITSGVWTDNATLSFQEIEGGSGGGGTTITKKWYEFKFADGMLTSNEIIFKLNEDNFNYIVGMINAMMKQQDPTWQDISTSQELVALYDQLKLLNDSTTILGLADLLYNGALDSDTIPYFYRDQWQKREILNSDMYVAGTTNTQNATPYCFLIVDANDNHTYEYVNLNASSTLVITETEETIGGGGSSTGGGSGKLYDIKFNLSMYDNSGNDKDFAFQNGGDTSYQVNYGSTLPIELLIYESNFERLKQAFNQNTYLNVNITDINSLVSTINGIDESSYSASNTSFLLLYALISYCDKAYICPSEIGGQTLPSTPKIPIFCDDFDVMLGALYICYETSTNVLSCKIVDHDSPETTDLNYFNVNNSCTLTEYGTSGGSGASATQKVYAFSLKTSTDGNAISTNNYVEMVAKISEDAFNNKFLPDLNAFGQQYAIANNETWVDITDVDSFVQFEAQVHNSGNMGMMLMATLVKYCLEDEKLAYAVLEDYSGGDGYLFLTASTVAMAAMLNNIAYNVHSVTTQTGVTSKKWFDNSDYSTYYLCFGSNSVSSLTYTEEQVAGGSGSGSSQPTIPERFSLAYNLVVNINQEQFANGSWTGSNSDNIRTFQYNGSNADETKAKELVEFLTGVNVLDSYNATKPTPCFVFCTQSNICWKLQWDNSLLHAYKVENFPFVVKGKYYRFVLNDNGCGLQLFITRDSMQQVYNAINQQMGTNISTPQEVVGVYNQLKGDSITPQVFGTLCLLFIGVYQLGVLAHLPTLFIGGTDSDANTLIGSATSTLNLYSIIGGSVEGIFDQNGSTGHIAHSSNANLTITENTDLDFD